MAKVGQSEAAWPLAFLIALLAGGVAIAWRDVFPPPRVAVDTKLRSGTHLTLVVIAPTAPNERFSATVGEGLNALRDATVSKGLIFGTIGVSDNWSVKKGLADLADIGPFDEVIVGRNWLNLGVQEYINRIGARAAVPQVIILVQTVRVDTIPFVYGDVTELARFVGLGELEAWRKSHYRVPNIPDERPESAAERVANEN